MDYKLVAFKEKYPVIHESVFLAAGVVIAADVSIAENTNIWFNSVIRGDVAPVIIGKNTNIQDGTVIHTSRFDGPTHIGDNITVGHMALLHACTVEDNAFIGMQAAVMDKAIVEEYGFVGAGSLVSPRKIVKRKELWMGRPAKFVRMVTDEEIDFMRGNVQNYLDLSNEYQNKNKHK
jgi:carbonic anhydrase/acetyltransferase-like protein (isoleucine patch superfamily)